MRSAGGLTSGLRNARGLAAVLAVLAGPPQHGLQLLLPPARATSVVPSPVRLEPDRVVRVLDANAVKLERRGVVRLAGASTPTVGLPECFRYTPSAHLRRALPAGERITVQITDSSRRLGLIAPRAVAGEPLAPTVNEQLVAGGWAKASRLGVDGDLADELARAQGRAQASHAGLWVSCAEQLPLVEARYEPIAGVPQTQPVALELGEGATVRQGSAGPQPPETRDRCGEFEYFEDAKRAFDAAPQRLARLDSDGDGVPCGGLPHRPEIERRQLKVPRPGARRP